MVGAVQAFSPSLFLNVSRIENLHGRLRVPVEPLYSIQARFKHIQGVPSRGGGVPMFKLRVLDNLIDHLLSDREGATGAQELLRLPENEMEPLITALEERLRTRVLDRAPLFGGFFPETGMLVDLAA